MFSIVTFHLDIVSVNMTFINQSMIIHAKYIYGRQCHYASKLEVILIEKSAWRLSHSKVSWKPPLLDELIGFGQRESALAILGLY